MPGIPAGTASVTIILTPKDSRGNPRALGNPLSVTSDQPETPTVDEADPLALKVTVPAPADITLDTNVTIKDSVDGVPSADINLDWDESSTVTEATQFGVTFVNNPA